MPLYFCCLLPRYVAAPASAETIGGALAKAYSYNSELNSARAGVRVTDENVAIAKSGYAPDDRRLSPASTTPRSAATASPPARSASQIQQTLFDGFQTKNNVRTAEARVRASNESLRNTEQNILFNAASAYMDVIRDRQIAVLRARNLEFLDEQVRAARSRFEVGEGTRTDVAQAEASRSAAVAQLAAARAQARGQCRDLSPDRRRGAGQAEVAERRQEAFPKASTRRSRSPTPSIRRSSRPSIWSMRPALP